jgi:hypothetical protein
MIRRGTWITLAVFVVFAGAAVLWTRYKPVPTVVGGTPTVTPEPLWTLGEGDIVGLRLEDLTANKTVEVKRSADGGWEMVQPTAGPADSARVEQAVAALIEPFPRETLPAPADLSPFGLAKPDRRLTLSLKDGVSRSVSIGRVSPTGGTIYVQLPGRSDVLLMSQPALQDVLGLLDDPPFPPTATAPPGTAPVVPRASATATETPVPGPSATPQPGVTPTIGVTGTP